MISEKLKTLPENPGCYMMKDKNGEIIYVGKAKNLKNRVRSYFTGSHNAKTTALVANIADFDYVITSSNVECLILEMNLIKKHSPKYNIKLMDDSSYPYIEITDESNPRIRITRRKKGKRVFGPYPNSTAARQTMDLLNKLYPFRKCNTIPHKECLYYHMHQCLAPCISTSNLDYSVYIKKATSFLKGNVEDIVDELNKKMLQYSENMQFEEAMETRDLIRAIETTTQTQKISLTDQKNRDIIGFYYDMEDISIQIFFMRKGSIVLTHKDVLHYIGDPIDTLYDYLLGCYGGEDSMFPIPSEILISKVDNELLSSVFHTKFITPSRGEKKKLLDLCNDNAKLTLDKQREIYRNREEKRISQVDSLKELLHMEQLNRIEAFDNSNIFGMDAVSGMVVFKDGKPSKNDYRKYLIKTVEGPDDYGSMREILYRRYYRMLIEDLERPDLIVMDGGEGQVNVAKEILDSLGLGDIRLIGLKKNDHHKTYSLIDGNHDNKEIVLSSKLPCYVLLTSIQEEVHRFAITFHRQRHTKSMFLSSLDDIKGLGPKGKEKIRKSFASLEELKNATLEDFQKLGISKEVSKKIVESFSVSKNNENE